MDTDQETGQESNGRGAGRPTALYRHFDCNGKLLYVGVSIDPIIRLKEHKGTSDWFREISSITIEWFPSRWLARRAEEDAILREAPTFNLMHNRKLIRDLQYRAAKCMDAPVTITQKLRDDVVHRIWRAGRMGTTQGQIVRALEHKAPRTEIEQMLNSLVRDGRIVSDYRVPTARGGRPTHYLSHPDHVVSAA